MMCPTVLVLGMCPDNAMPAYCGGAQLIRRQFVCFGFIWEISVDGHARVPPSWGAGNRDYGISASGSDVFRVWMHDKTVGTLQLWTVNAVFTPGSLFVLEEATFTRVHSCKLSSWLDICMSEILLGVRAQILHLWCEKHIFWRWKLQMGKENHKAF